MERIYEKQRMRLGMQRCIGHGTGGELTGSRGLEVKFL